MTLMKVGIVGTGRVGALCAFEIMGLGYAREIVLVDKLQDRAEGVAFDQFQSTGFTKPVVIRQGSYEDLTDAQLVVIAAGINEKAGGATNRADPQGRLRLLQANAAVYREIVPEIVKFAAEALLMVVTDPPDPLADLTRRLAGHDRVISSGTLLDSNRFEVHLAKRLRTTPCSVHAVVIGEHGTSQVFLWSSANVCCIPVLEVLGLGGNDTEKITSKVEEEVRFANISIIDGNDASQYCISKAVAKLTDIILRDSSAVVPVGSYNPHYGLTLSLPSCLGKNGVSRILPPRMTNHERELLEKSADFLRQAAKTLTD
jgi:L-lactate dehydrogenase